MPRLEDYPFDPSLEGKTERYYGLNKLRTIRDESMRRYLFELYCNINRLKPSDPDPAKGRAA